MERPTQRLDQPSGNAPAYHCPKCGEAMTDAEAVSSGAGQIILVKVVDKSVLWGTVRRRTTCTAWVCIECGYTEFYAAQPRKLLE
jgi:predicted nucleic-acid-binding Zn-ribbon protein